MDVPKLICSDIDGTLIPYGEKVLPGEVFPLIRRLKAAGILFCPASGRQYHSLRRLFTPVADEVCFLCENGAVIFGVGREDTAPVLAKTVIPRTDALALSLDMMAVPGVDTCISGLNTTYLPHASAAMMDDMEHRLGNNVKAIDDPEEIGEDIVKISAFCPVSLEPIKAALGPRWGETYHMAEAGPVWLDFTLANKGTGVRGLCAALDMDPGEVWAFGDNWNDVGMLEEVGTPWLMAAAAPQLRERFPRQCDDVLSVLEALLREAEG